MRLTVLVVAVLLSSVAVPAFTLSLVGPSSAVEVNSSSGGASSVAEMEVAEVDGVASAQEEGTVVGRPSIELSATENRVGAGEQVALDVFVSNNGDIDRGGPAEFEQGVTTVRNVRLEIDESRMDEEFARRIEIETGTVFAGSVPEGVSGQFAFNVEFGESLSPGTYEISVEVTYDYTSFVRYGPNRQPEYGDSSRSTTAYVTVVVEDRPRFDIQVQNLTRVSAGDDASYRLNVTNTGTRPAVNAQVSLSAANSSSEIDSRLLRIRGVRTETGESSVGTRWPTR